MVKLAENTLETVQNSFPKIIKIALNIAYSNGMINRSEPEVEYLTRIADIIAKRPLIKVIQLEVDLQNTTDEQLMTIADGEHEEAQALLAQHCKEIGFANVLFDEFFEGE